MWEWTSFYSFSCVYLHLEIAVVEEKGSEDKQSLKSLQEGNL